MTCTPHPIEEALGKLKGTSIFPTELPSHLYHYTNAEGLRGILCGQLWATDISYMGDQLEYNHADHLEMEELQRIFGHSAESIISKIRADFRCDNVRVYAASLSEAPDLTNQWLVYGDHGSGYQIEFDRRALTKVNIDPWNVGFRAALGKVEYDRAQQSAQLRSTFRPLEGLVSDPRPQDQRFNNELFTATCEIKSTLAIQRAFFKSKDFEPEQEWRLMILGCIAPPPRISAHDREEGCSVEPVKRIEQFRVRNSSLVPYVPIELAPLPITKITIGPNHHTPELVRSAVKRLLWLHDLDIPVCRSRLMLPK